MTHAVKTTLSKSGKHLEIYGRKIIKIMIEEEKDKIMMKIPNSKIKFGEKKKIKIMRNIAKTQI